jgi:SAM-dependent methyltransferase
MPLANSYVSTVDAAKECARYPLVINYCKNCSMSQLSLVVDPSIMFKKYFYRSSISRTFIKHCAELARESSQRFGFSAGDLVVDIASNDGACLREFKKTGTKVLGIDPAENLAKIAIESGVHTIARFWNEETAKEARNDHGSARMITAMNVFAHVDDLGSFLKGVNILLQDNGIFLIECPYMANFIKNTEFDTTYHEHLSYFPLKPIMVLMSKYELEVFDAKLLNIHGGTIRIYVQKRGRGSSRVRHDVIESLLNVEKHMGLYDVNTYLKFSDKVRRIRTTLISTIQELKSKKKKIAAYGASAKGNILSNYCGFGKNDIEYIIDDTPEKQGLLAPGHHIPIVSARMLEEYPPDYLILLAWNFSKELMEKTAIFRSNGGKYIIPIPEVKIIPKR